MDLSPATPPKPTSVASAVDSSPSPSPAPPKLRLMCSYGGHIVPRPADKTLCYAGGDTRIVAVDRRSAFSLSFLTAHLSKSLFNGRPFCLKYQLPNHDLDSLISIANDEDLANMIDEYDRLAAAAGSASRLRFFLFPSRSSAADEDCWFIDALRNAGVVAKVRSSDTDSDGKVAASTVVGVSSGSGGGGGGVVADSGTSLPESIVLEKNLSFESTSSSASTSNSPAIISGGGGGGGEEGIGVRLHDVKVVLPTVDSIGSDSSFASPNFSPQAIVYQDAPVFESKVVSANHFEAESDASDHSPGYVLTKPMDPSLPPQPQYVHLSPGQSHYMTHYYANQMPVASYPMMYHQPYAQPHQPVQYQMNEPYPVYMMPSGRTQNPYDMPEYGANVYRTPAVATQPVNVHTNDYNPQVVAFPPLPPENTNYRSEYEDPMHAQIYKTQPPGPTLPSHTLQTAANATTAMLSEAFSQLHVDNKH